MTRLQQSERQLEWETAQRRHAATQLLLARCASVSTVADGTPSHSDSDDDDDNDDDAVAARLTSTASACFCRRRRQEGSAGADDGSFAAPDPQQQQQEQQLLQDALGSQPHAADDTDDDATDVDAEALCLLKTTLRDLDAKEEQQQHQQSPHIVRPHSWCCCVRPCRITIIP